MSKLNSENGQGGSCNVGRAAKMGVAIVALAVFATVNSANSAAQTVPLMGYVANDNAGPERIAAFKKGLTDLGYIEGKNLTPLNASDRVRSFVIVQ